MTYLHLPSGNLHLIGNNGFDIRIHIEKKNDEILAIARALTMNSVTQTALAPWLICSLDGFWLTYAISFYFNSISESKQSTIKDVG